MLLAATPFIKIPIYTAARGIVSNIGSERIDTVDSSLTVICRLPLSSMGLITTGQLVSIHIDAYPAQRWGVLSARVIRTDDRPAIDVVSNTSYVNVHCKTDQNYLSLKNGRKVSVKEGHPLTARFSIAERSLWQLAFDQLDDIIIR